MPSTTLLSHGTTTAYVPTSNSSIELQLCHLPYTPDRSASGGLHTLPIDLLSPHTCIHAYLPTSLACLGGVALGGTLRVVLQQSSSVGPHSQTWQPVWGATLSSPSEANSMYGHGSWLRNLQGHHACNYTHGATS